MKTENVDNEKPLNEQGNFQMFLTFSNWNIAGNSDLIWDGPINTKRKENRFYKTKKEMERKVISDCVCVLSMCIQ